LAGQTYLWLGLEALVHGAQDIDLAGGQTGGVGAGSFAGHDVAWYVLNLMCR
jgi:hypothetical protein